VNSRKFLKNNVVGEYCECDKSIVKKCHMVFGSVEKW
jgi:hypothetical protein